MPFMRYHAERGGLGDLRHPPLLQSVERKIPVHNSTVAAAPYRRYPTRAPAATPPVLSLMAGSPNPPIEREATLPWSRTAAGLRRHPEMPTRCARPTEGFAGLPRPRTHATQTRPNIAD